MIWPTCPAFPLTPSSSSPSITIPPETEVDTEITQKLDAPLAAPSQPSASAIALPLRSPNTGNPVRSRRCCLSSKLRHDDTLTGETVSQLRSIGPSHPMPIARTRTRCWLRACSSCSATIPASAASGIAAQHRVPDLLDTDRAIHRGPSSTRPQTRHR